MIHPNSTTMADLLAMLQSKADEMDNETKKKETELKEKQEQEKALEEMRAGLVEKKRAFDAKKKLLEERKRHREAERAAMAATGIHINMATSEDVCRGNTRKYYYCYIKSDISSN